MKKYCMNCGSATDFSFVKPKFCSSCGTTFDVGLGVDISIRKPNIINNISKPSVINKNLGKIDSSTEDYDDGEDVLHVPNLSKIDCDYEVQKHQGVKFKSMVDSNIPPMPAFKGPKQKAKKMNKKEMQEFLDAFKRESGSIRPKK